MIQIDKKESEGKRPNQAIFYTQEDYKYLDDEIDVDMAFDCGISRMLLYIAIDQWSQKDSPEVNLQLDSLLDSKKDILSHFILRAAMCSSAQDMSRFLNSEVKILKYKLELGRINPESYSIGTSNFEVVDGKSVRNKFSDYFDRLEYSEKSEFFRIPFLNVPSSLDNHTALLSDGFVFLPKNNMKDYILHEYRQSLDSAIQRLRNQRTKLEDERLVDILSKIRNFEPAEEATSITEISIDSLPFLAKQSFPPCMQNMYNTLIRYSKLKYNGREQLCRFLRSIGLSRDDSILFFSRIFTKLMTVDKFNREYLYNIRYVYGDEGRKIAMGSYKCQRLVLDVPVGAENENTCGCPFAYFNETRMRQFLEMSRIPADVHNSIVQHSQSKRYGDACRTFFECTHPEYSNSNFGFSPVGYFKCSQGYYTEKKSEPKSNKNYAKELERK